MKKFALLIKPGCKNCDFIYRYLKSQDVFFEVWNVEEKEIIERLMKDPKFNRQFCDVEECYSSLPAIRLSDTGEYYFGEDFIDFKRFYTLNKLLEIEQS